MKSSTAFVVFGVLAVLLGSVSAQTIPVTTQWSQVENKAVFALSNVALSAWDASPSKWYYAVVGGQNNTVNGEGTVYNNTAKALETYSTTDTLNYPNHLFLFQAYRDENNAPGQLITTIIPFSGLDTFGYAGASASYTGSDGKAVMVLGGVRTVEGVSTFYPISRRLSYSVYRDEDNPYLTNFTYTAPTQLAAPYPMAYHSAISFNNDNTIVTFGGITTGGEYTNQISHYVLSGNTSSWTAPAVNGTAPSPRAYHAAVKLDNIKMLIFGGNDNVTCFNDTFTYDYSTKRWASFATTIYKIPVANLGVYNGRLPPGTSDGTTFTPILRGRTGVKAEILTASNTGKTYVIIFGGQTQDGEVLNEILALDVSAKVWYFVPTTAFTPSARSHYGSVRVDDHTLVYWGGTNGTTVLPTIHYLAIRGAEPTIPEEPSSDDSARLVASVLTALLALAALLFC